MIRNLGQVAAIYMGSSQPTNTNLIWLDNTVVPYAFRAHDGSTWSELATRDWVKMFVDGWLVSLPPSTQAGDTDYLLINSNNVNYKITVKEFVKSAVGNPLDFKGVIRTDADFPNPANCEAGDMYVIITSPAGGTVTDPYSGQVFEDTEKIVWDEVTKSWASLGKIEINVDLSTDYSATNVTINSSAGKSTTIEAASTSLAGVMLPQQVKRLTYLSNGSTVPGDPSELDPDTPAHKHNYGDILDRLISQQETGDSTFHPMSQKATTDNLDLKFDKENVVQVQGASTVMVMSQKAVTDAITTLDEWIKNELTKYLPLAGGNMYGALVMNNNVGVNAKNTLGKTYNLAVLDSNNQVQLGTTSYSTRINSSASDLIHQRSSTQYKIWDSYNLSKPTVYNGGAIGTPTTIYDRNLSVNGTGWTFLSATNAPTTSIFAPTTVGTKGYYLVSSGTGAPVWQQLEDLGDGKYLPLIGGTLTGQLTIKQSVDIKLRLQSTDADNYCIIQAINAQASQLGVFGYAGDKWAIGHNGIYYEIWDKYNLTNPVTYTTDTYNYATLTNKDGQYFTYIKAGTNGLLPHSKATLVSGGSGFLGTSDQSFNAAYINNLHTNKVTFGVNGSYIIGGTSATQFLDANGGVQKVATGGLYVGVSYASDALNLVPTNGIYSHGNIKSSGWLEFTNNEWTDTGWAYKEAQGSLKVLSVTNEAENKPTSYGSVLQFNSRRGYWCTQIWCDQTNVAGVIGKLRFRTTKNYASTEWNPWTAIATEPYVSSNYLPLTGGTLSGNLTINTVVTPTFVINNSDTNGSETFMRVLRKGTASAAIGFRDSLGAYIYNYNSKKYLFIDNDGYARVGTTSGSTRLALITDIPTVSGYLPLSGGTMSGNISFNGDTGHIVVGARETSNFVSAVSFTKGSATNSAYIGYHSTGGDGNGAIIIRPYYDKGDGWSTAKGLYISKGQLLIDGASVATQTWVSSQGFLKTAPSISITTSGSGNVVTGISASGHTLTVTKGSASVSVSWNDITGKPSSFTPSAHTHEYIVGKYTGSGGVIAPGSIGAYKLQCNMMYVNAESSGGGYCDWILMNAYSWGDVPYATAIGVVKAATPSAYIMSGPNSTDKSTWVRKKLATTDEIPTRTSDLTNNSGFLTSSSLSGYATQSWVTSQGYLTSSSLSGYATQTWVNNKNYAVQGSGNNLIVNLNEFNFANSNTTAIYLNYRSGVGGNTTNPITEYKFCNGQGSDLGVKINAETFVGALSGNATTATTATKLGSTTIGGTAKPIYLSSGTATACSATVGSSTVPVYMSSGTITQCSTTLGVSITGNAATATNATQLGGTAASSYVKANDNISRLTNDRNYVRSTSTLKVSDIQVLDGGTPESEAGILYIVLE